MNLSRYSLEYVFVDVTGDSVAGLTHELAIVPESQAVVLTADWKSVTWDTTETAARILVRATTDAETGGDITLTLGRHSVYWRASSNPEYPARKAGTLTVR